MSTSTQHPQIIVRIILIRDGKTLLLKRQISKGGGYSLIGGKVDPGEKILDALKREALEESGIHLKKKHLELVHIVNRKKSRFHTVTLFYLSHKWSGKIENREPEHCESLDWFDLNKLPENMTPNAKQAMLGVFDKNYFSEMS